MTLHVSALGAIFRGSIVKGTNFATAKDLSTIRYTPRSLKLDVRITHEVSEKMKNMLPFLRPS